ncbi:MAG: L-threonylcarbamoyladenylate synthase [Flavobacteriales bacterium]
MTAKPRRSEPWHEDARIAVQVLRSGGIVLHATDTVWGLACDATNDEAVTRMNALKSRHPEHPVLVLVADEGHVEELVSEVPEAAWDLMEHSDRPTTVIYPEGKGVSPLLLGGDGSLAVRCIRDPYSAYVIRGLGRPVASTSANVTGGPTPKSFRDVPESLRTGADHVSAHRRDERDGSGIPSMIVAFDEEGRFRFVRK